MYGYLRNDGHLLCPHCACSDLYQWLSNPTHLTCRGCLRYFHEDEAKLEVSCTVDE